MNKYLTKKTRLFFFVQYLTVEKVTQRHFHTVCMFVTPSAIHTVGMSLNKSEYHSQMPQQLGPCATQVISSSNSTNAPPPPLPSPPNSPHRGPGEVTANWP